MAITTQISLNREQLFSLIDAIESVHIENQTAEQLKVNDELIPVLEQALDEIDALDQIQRMAELVIKF